MTFEATISFTVQPGSSLPVLVRDPDSNRAYLFVQNRGPNPIYVATGRSATAADIELAGDGDYWEPSPVPQDSINVFSPTGGAGVAVQV